MGFARRPAARDSPPRRITACRARVTTPHRLSVPVTSSGCTRQWWVHLRACPGCSLHGRAKIRGAQRGRRQPRWPRRRISLGSWITGASSVGVVWTGRDRAASSSNSPSSWRLRSRPPVASSHKLIMPPPTTISSARNMTTPPSMHVQYPPRRSGEPRSYATETQPATAGSTESHRLDPAERRYPSAPCWSARHFRRLAAPACRRGQHSRLSCALIEVQDGAARTRALNPVSAPPSTSAWIHRIGRFGRPVGNVI
jgi:hypothetical protein